MIAVITGDIINSRKVNSDVWLNKLKSFLSEKIKNEEQWEIYRGDSFQIELKVEDALEMALKIKALIKTNSTIDVRISIGIGEKDFQGKSVKESYGSAHIFSGEGFEKLNNDTLIVKSPFKKFDEYFNPILKLISFIANNWKPATAETVFNMLNNKELLQKDLAAKMQKDTTTVSKALKRAGYSEINEIIDLYKLKISECLN